MVLTGSDWPRTRLYSDDLSLGTMRMTAASTYLQRHQLVPAQIADAPSPRLGLSVVIPCHNEPDLLTTLSDLWGCKRAFCDAEILIVINGSEVDGEAVRRRNRDTRRETLAWVKEHRDPRLLFHVLYFPSLARRHAGVGLARKLGMDEAVARFHRVGQAGGIIASLDADCRCQPNYLVSLCEHFQRNPKSPGCAIHFEHPLEGLRDTRMRRGMVRYELYLRYFVHGMRHAGFAHAYQTVGSCMAVRSPYYEKRGGMNRRQAGEDFYFLHKIISLGGFTELTRTTVTPAARPSHRVPFGTGKTLAAWLEGEDSNFWVYAPQVFLDLRTLFERMPQLYAGIDYPKGLAPTMLAFLKDIGFAERLAEIRANTATSTTFAKRFWHWFNAFRILKFVHYATRQVHPKVPVEDAALRMLGLRQLPPPPYQVGLESEALLDQYRRVDRQGRYFTPAASAAWGLVRPADRSVEGWQKSTARMSP